jgi:deoxyribodipyrimidine photo-lyase
MEWWKILFKILAWLAMGCISPRTIYKEIRAYEKENGANDSTYWLILNYYGVISFALCSKNTRLNFLICGYKAKKKNNL